MDTNIVNIKSVSEGWCLFVSSNTSVIFKGEFMEKLSNIEAELEKSVAYIKKTCNNDRAASLDIFCKKVFWENFVKITGKYLCRSLFLNKVSGLRWHKYNTFLANTSGGDFFQMSPKLKRRRTEHIEFTNELKRKQNTNWKLLFWLSNYLII